MTKPADSDQIANAREPKESHNASYRAGWRDANKQWESWGVVEVAVRNLQVADYCKHWEERAQKAASERQAVKEECCRAVCELCAVGATHFGVEMKAAEYFGVGKLWRHCSKSDKDFWSHCKATAIRSMERDSRKTILGRDDMTNEALREIGRKIGNAVNPELEAIELLGHLGAAVSASADDHELGDPLWPIYQKLAETADKPHLTYSGWLRTIAQKLEREFFAAAPAQEPPDKAMLEAIAEDGLLVTWDKDFKFNFSQVVRLMAEFVIEHPWADAAQERDADQDYAECSDEAVKLLNIIENAADYEEGCEAVFELRKMLPNLDRYVKDEVADQMEKAAAQEQPVESGPQKGNDV